MPRKIGIALCTALSLIVTVGHARRAFADKPAVAILGLEVIDDGSGMDEQAAAVALGLTRALRHRAGIGKGAYQLAPNTDKDLIEMKLLSDCADEGRECMAAIGAGLGAARLLFGKVERRGDGFQVSIKLLNVETQNMERTVSDLVPFTEADGEGTKNWGRRFYNRLTGMPDDGSVRVRANVDKGTVSLDGEIKTTLSAGSARVSGLAEGTHTLTVDAKGYARYTDSVVITAGETTEVAVVLEPRGGSAVDRAARPGGGYRALFWTSVVATGASVATFTVTGLQVRTLEDDKQKQFEIVHGQLIAGGEDLSGYARDANGDFADVCRVASDHQTGYADAKKVVDTCDRGRSRAMLTNIFIGTSVATALAATYFYYKGYMAPKSATERASLPNSQRPSGPSVTITPSVGPNVVGAGVAIQF
jgi:hypothetical protein